MNQRTLQQSSVRVNDANKSKLHARRNQQLSKFGRRLLPFGAQCVLSSSLLSETISITTYRTVTLPVVLCGCETWSLVLNVFKSRVKKVLFLPMRERHQEAGQKLPIVKPHRTATGVTKSRMMNLTAHVARIGT
jgi:hypothetical protein